MWCQSADLSQGGHCPECRFFWTVSPGSSVVTDTETVSLGVVLEEQRESSEIVKLALPYVGDNVVFLALLHMT